MSGPDKDIQTWLRLVSKNIYVRRRQLDTKAATVFSLSSMMASVGFSTYGYVRQYPIIVTLLVSFVGVCFVAMYFGVHAMHPKIRGPGRPTEEELKDGVPILTAFEYFRNMSEDEYTVAVRRVLSDEASVRTSLSKDIHEVGVRLGARFRWLRLAYGMFGFSLLIVILTFVYIQWKMFT